MKTSFRFWGQRSVLTTLKTISRLAVSVKWRLVKVSFDTTLRTRWKNARALTPLLFNTFHKFWVRVRVVWCWKLANDVLDLETKRLRQSQNVTCFLELKHCSFFHWILDTVDTLPKTGRIYSMPVWANELFCPSEKLFFLKWRSCLYSTIESFINHVQ